MNDDDWPEWYKELPDLLHNPELATDPVALEFLDAGTRLLHRDLLNDTPLAPSEVDLVQAGLLRAITRQRVIDEAAPALHASAATREEAGNLEWAFRRRWEPKENYLVDLVVFSLGPRTATPEEIDVARKILHSGVPLSEVIDRIAYHVVSSLRKNPAFRLQMIFQATLAKDYRVAYVLHKVDERNVNAWREFYDEAIRHFGLRLKPEVELDHFAYALHTAGEGVVFRALLRNRGDRPVPPLDPERRTSSLAPIAKAIIAEFLEPADPGGG